MTSDPATTAPAPQAALAALHPAYFALVMATGIVSLACWLMHAIVPAKALLGLNVIFYLAIWALLIARIARYPARVAADFVNHGRCVGFFTTVAATGILGSQFLLIAGQVGLAAALWILAILLWALLTYSIFTILTIKPVKPSLPDGINGGWLLAVVATQALAVLGAQLAVPMGWTTGPVLFFSLVVWLGGGMLYIWIISLIFYRYTFFALSPDDLSPPYWINMGAVAISTLAGALLAENAAYSPVVAGLLPFIKGATLLFWATATWWIPMLIILGLWRHGYRRFPLRYDPLYWGVVFPLGMYTVCTIRLEQVFAVPFLRWLPGVFIYFAAAAWLATFLGLLHRLFTLARGKMAR